MKKIKKRQPETSRESLAWDIALKRDEILALIKDWTFEAMPAESDNWQKMVNGARRKMERRKFKNTLRKALGLDSLRGYRSPRFVENEYSQTWSAKDFPSMSTATTAKHRLLAEWNGTGYVVHRDALRRLHMVMLERTIQQLKPRSVLEVGSGPGTILLALAGRFPKVKFHGLELTAAGVARALEMQAINAVPEEWNNFIPWTMSLAAIKAASFTQGSATSMPFVDQQFDLVYSNTALEQMETIRDQAIPEMKRVSAEWVVMNEPFADANRSEIQKLAIAAKNYLTLPVSGLSDHGLDVKMAWQDWPLKLLAGYTFVISRKK